MFEKKTRYLMLLFAVLLVFATGCPEDSDLDDEDGPPVVFEVSVITTPSVTAAQDPVLMSCANPVFTVTEWQATGNNLPKNSNAITSPFNDIELVDLTTTYTCPGVAVGCPPQRTQGLTGTVPANGTVGFTFPPVFLQDVNGSLEGTSINVDMVFRARAISGEDLTYRTGALLQVDSCL
jgi:hypothetical protein